MEAVLALAVALGVVTIALILVLARNRSARGIAALEPRLESMEKGQERAERGVREEIARSRDESRTSAKELRDEVGSQLLKLTEMNERRLGELRQIVDERLKQIQEESGAKLDEMRKTVDEQLQGTLEKRLGEAFKQVSERLEVVHRGLGEMQSLAAGVGDLKKVLTNVKTRGTWGEVQLGSLLEQILTPDQYERNVAPKPDSGERVEFAIRLPGHENDAAQPVWLPIDAKFPQEDYQRLLEAEERSDPAGIEEAAKQLENRVKGSAREIRDKYLSPPETTDFGIMFLPTEGLYAEILRRPGLADTLQREFRVVIAGPTTLAALLNSLQMGFRTLAIQQRSSEVWKLLGAVKNQFGQFTGILEKVQTKLQQASTTIDNAARKSRTIEGRLKKVEALPSAEAEHLLPELGESEAEATDAEVDEAEIEEPEEGEA